MSTIFCHINDLVLAILERLTYASVYPLVCLCAEVFLLLSGYGSGSARLFFDIAIRRVDDAIGVETAGDLRRSDVLSSLLRMPR